MSADANTKTIMSVYEAFGRGDVAAILDAVEDDVDWAAEANPAVAPWHGVRHGKDAVAAFFAEFGSTMEVEEFTPVSVAANDNDVLTVVRFRARSRATGKTAAMDLHHYFAFRDGKIAYYRGTEDTAQTQAGILIAHVFFNLPLATRLLLQALDTIPDDQWRLAAQLGMGARSAFRFLEWPAMRASLPGVAGLVFMLCITSFTIVLLLGGGPGATTLEVAIYQALRFDFDPARAVALTLLQIVLTLALFAAIARFGGAYAAMANASVGRRRFVLTGSGEKALNLLVIALAFLFVAGPMAAVVISGLAADLGKLVSEEAVQRATLTSLLLAVPAAFLSVSLSLALVACRRALEYRRRGKRTSWLEWLSGSGANLVLVLPPTVIGAGWFVLLLRSGEVYAAAPAMVIAVNALMAMPFAVRVVRPAYDTASARHERLCASLGIAGWNRLRLIDGPALRRPLGTALAFAMALSLGDLGVIALFGSDHVRTLPYLLMQRMGSYRTEDAAGIALLLGVLCLLLMTVSDRLARDAA